jgi:hypothetical protein
MKTTAATNVAGRPFSLPMMAVFSVSSTAERTVAHALDFDLVAVAATKDEALRKLRLAVKHHVEYGLENSFDLDILFPAPEQCWSALTPDSNLSIGEPIEICHRYMATATKTLTKDEHHGSLAAA